MRLRSYQQEAIDAILRTFDSGVRSTLATLPTGSGKTLIFAHAADHHSKGGKRIMVIAHRTELLTQAAKKIRAMTGMAAEVEKADQYARVGDDLGWQSPFIVASIQSLISGRDGQKRYQRFNPADFALVVFDEAHHCPSDSYMEVAAHFKQNPDLNILGVTATGDRGDGEGLGCVFDSVAFEYEMPDAIRDGWLVPVRQLSVTVEGLDFSSCRTTAGDLNQADLAAVMEFEATLHPIAHAAIEAAYGMELGSLAMLRDDPDRAIKLKAMAAGRTAKKTLVFCTSVAQADRMAEIFNRWIAESAKTVNGKTDEQVRSDVLAEYAAGAFPFLTNVGIATEGFDVPGIELVVMGRPTKSRSLAIQMIGRGTRPIDALAPILGELPDVAARIKAIADSVKPSVTILDFVGNCGKHKLVTSVDILAGKNGDTAIIDRAKEIAAEKSGDVMEALEEAEIEVQEQRQIQQVMGEVEAEHLEIQEQLALLEECAKRAIVVATAEYQTHEVGEHDHSPVRASAASKGGASDKQIDFLVKLGVHRETAQNYSKKQAGAVITSLKESRCTVGQGNYLRRLGLDDAEIAGMNFEAASKAIEERVGTA